MKNNAHAALKAAVIGDALGVPYEFHRPEALPSWGDLEMLAPASFKRSHALVPPGTWSDDSALMLALMDSLNAVQPFSLEDFSARMLRWFQDGAYTPDGRVFDVGFQTRDALGAIARGVSPTQSGRNGDHDNGNGSLMRVLPVAFLDAPTPEIIRLAMWQSVPTHPHLRSQLCCAVYALLVHQLLVKASPNEAMDLALGSIRSFIATSDQPLQSALERELFTILRVRDKGQVKKGSGYVVDTLWSAWEAFSTTPDVESCLKKSISFGYDTDTVACVAGGLAGARHGLDSIPNRWLQGLQGMAILDALCPQS
jgi:ADP-ribosyl-[dinitrogen reductase] hydrolase